MYTAASRVTLINHHGVRLPVPRGPVGAAPLKSLHAPMQQQPWWDALQSSSRVFNFDVASVGVFTDRW